MATAERDTDSAASDRRPGADPGAGSAPSEARSASVSIRVLATGAAIGLFAVGVGHPLFRDPGGELSGSFVVPLSLAAAVLLTGWAAGTRWLRPAGWFSLAVVGQAVALQLIRAGFMVGHQHYVPAGELLDARHLPALGFLLLQAGVVVAGGRRHLRDGAGLPPWRPWQWSVLGAAFVLTGATLSREAHVYAVELVFAAAVQAVQLATVVLAALAVPGGALRRLGSRLDRSLGRNAGDGRGGLDRFALAGAAWVFLTCALLAWFVYQNHPHVPDELVYLYHARYFASGMWFLPAPPVPEAFNVDLMTFEPDRWYSPVPPGWPAALAVGALFGVPWLVNPALNAVNALLAYALLGRLYDRYTSRLAFVLLCASPWFLFMGMNFMTHTFTLTCALAAAIAVARLREGGGWAWTVAGGVALGVMGTIRPLEGLTVSVLLGLWGLGSRPWRFPAFARIAALALFAMATGALTLPYNAMLAGDPLTFPLMAYTDAIYGAGTNALGFGANRGLGWPGLDPFMGHGALDVAINANLNAHGVNVELLGWAAGSVLPIAFLLVSRRMIRPDAWMVAVIAAIVGVHSLYWFSGGPDFGARYWYMILVPCIALAARGVVVLGEEAVRSAGGADAGEAASTARDWRTRATAGAFALSVAALVTFMPWRAADKYFHYRNMRPDVRRIAAEREFGRSLVLVRGNRHPDYASAAAYNPLDLRADAPVYVWDRDADITSAALREYADRSVWILDGPTRTGGGFRVVAGPVAARDLLARGIPPY